jgi:transcriptional regulator with XRE-family HTH domain
LESNISYWAPTFRGLQTRLITFVNARIQNGEFSERSLARQLGLSQPQLHNVLKGARKLQTALADAFLTHFGISIKDLMIEEEMKEPRTSSLLSEETARLRLLRKSPAPAQSNRPKLGAG